MYFCMCTVQKNNFTSQKASESSLVTHTTALQRSQSMNYIPTALMLCISYNETALFPVSWGQCVFMHHLFSLWHSGILYTQ